MLTTSLAAVLAWARRHPLIAATPLILTPIVWNYWLMVQYTAGTIPKDAPVSFATMVRQQADVHTRPPYAYPFAFPGNAISAWREGVPFWRYDMLAAEPRLEAIDVLFDRTGDRYLLDGWGALASNASGWFRPIVDDGATMLAPLQPAARAYEIALMVQPRSEASLGMTVDIAINGSAIGRIVMDRPEPFESRLRVPATDVGRILRAGYNRVSIVPARPALVAVYRLRLTPIA
jgi:hypothetical protein